MCSGGQLIISLLNIIEFMKTLQVVKELSSMQITLILVQSNRELFVIILNDNPIFACSKTKIWMKKNQNYLFIQIIINMRRLKCRWISCHDVAALLSTWNKKFYNGIWSYSPVLFSDSSNRIWLTIDILWASSLTYKLIKQKRDDSLLIYIRSGGQRNITVN